jgi:hypothetical protein
MFFVISVTRLCLTRTILARHVRPLQPVSKFFVSHFCSLDHATDYKSQQRHAYRSRDMHLTVLELPMLILPSTPALDTVI